MVKTKKHILCFAYNSQPFLRQNGRLHSKWKTPLLQFQKPLTVVSRQPSTHVSMELSDHWYWESDCLIQAVASFEPRVHDTHPGNFGHVCIPCSCLRDRIIAPGGCHHTSNTVDQWRPCQGARGATAKVYGPRSIKSPHVHSCL